jgi:transcriptional regulator with XRE-family HTH domain
MPVVNERLLLRRHRERLHRLGEEIRRLREDAGRSQRTVARVAGIARSHLTEIEAGDAEPSVLALERIAMALGADLGVRYFANTGPRIRDHLQVAMSEELLRSLHPRWRATPEVPVYRPVHGVIDLVVEDRDGSTTIETELHSQLRRLEQQGRMVSRLLVLRNTQATREAVRAATQTLAAAYPARTGDAVAALQDGDAWPGPALLWMTLEHGRARLLGASPRGISLGR